MTLTQLEVFSTVAELRGFTAAAHRLGISQSAVSHSMKALEDELGVLLVLRGQNVVELTDIGGQLLGRARAMLGLAETIRQEASATRDLQQGLLRIGSFGPTSSIHMIPQIMNVFSKYHPGIEVQIDEGPDNQIVQWLQERRIDIGFVVLPDDRFKTYLLETDQMVAVIPEQHRLASKNAIALAELCEDPFLLTEAGSTDLIQRMFAKKKLVPRIKYRCSQIMSTLDIVSRGAAVTVIAKAALPKYPRGWVSRPLDPPVERDVGLAVLNEAESSPATRAFIKSALRSRVGSS